MKVQIIENENFIDKADFNSCEIWLLNRTQKSELDERIINVPEISESFFSSAEKFPKLLTEISNKYFKDGIVPADFDYEILTNNKENFAIHAFVCSENKIKVV